VKIDKEGKEITWHYGGNASAGDLLGRVVIKVDQSDEEIIFHFEDGYVARFYHEQDCCESVWVEDVNGYWDDLIGVPLLVSDERCEVGARGEWGDTSTYTFYTFRTNRGSVDVRWFGSSNGYYSESVDLLLYKEV